ncbi:hypothetical protein GYMLUDRAFT_43785 [Collybiopsis luxurians FD-317 M1]|uniref:Protein kinase domain-containing protein n=1 Tax=Collybiopsis luxurians FD-317 M1 TaxID=944289 RepID=A0A0D0CNU4_9AGAR|nr:hypothetical protein GYMLUDRAFT_43785 [Collybiopsis luxurians FD-317 M1]
MAEELHSYGVRHNDLSAHNILRNHDGTLAIIDFDCAELSHECQGPANCAELKDFAEVLKLSI